MENLMEEIKPVVMETFDFQNGHEPVTAAFLESHDRVLIKGSKYKVC